ncbi:hypothetical protein PS659_04119 [Pseudomonas fluorescens]|uniref:Uncharacterized protein n=3 Tax=Pseudomonas TaxID=286 RepID=A0A5E6VE22_PSEFL|nr:hypothetical protein PS659_04119 [Pseudomonas fluorescens]
MLGCFFGSCAWETFGSAGFTIVRFANPRTATTLFVWRQLSGRSSTYNWYSLMKEFMALTSNADDLPSLFVNTTQPLHSLLSTASYRIRAVTQLLENLAMRGDLSSDTVVLSDFALLCCVPLRDGCDVLDVIARRMDAEPS